jgi:RNA polymerase sigma-70 factor, ECF subfamily
LRKIESEAQTVPETAEITQLLIRWSNGEETARDALLPLVYDELRRMASSYLRAERREHTLQPTAIVHEAYLRLVDQTSVNWRNRAQFFGLASTLMRNILVDYARRQLAQKRGGAQIKLTLDEADRLGVTPEFELLALEEALTQLAAIKPRHSRLVELRFFAGLTIEETAAMLGVSHTTVEQDWTFAKAWLRRVLGGG